MVAYGLGDGMFMDSWGMALPLTKVVRHKLEQIKPGPLFQQVIHILLL